MTPIKGCVLERHVSTCGRIFPTCGWLPIATLPAHCCAHRCAPTTLTATSRQSPRRATVVRAMSSTPSRSPHGLTKHSKTQQLHATGARWPTHVLSPHTRGHIVECMPPLACCAACQFFQLFYKSCR